MAEKTRLKHTQTLRNIFFKTTAYFFVKICKIILHYLGDTTILKLCQNLLLLRSYEVSRKGNWNKTFWVCSLNYSISRIRRVFWKQLVDKSELLIMFHVYMKKKLCKVIRVGKYSATNFVVIRENTKYFERAILTKVDIEVQSLYI